MKKALILLGIILLLTGCSQRGPFSTALPQRTAAPTDSGQSITASNYMIYPYSIQVADINQARNSPSTFFAGDDPTSLFILRGDYQTLQWDFEKVDYQSGTREVLESVPLPYIYSEAYLSPDGRFVVYEINEKTNRTLYLYDSVEGTYEPLLSLPIDFFPPERIGFLCIWSEDSSRMFYGWDLDALSQKEVSIYAEDYAMLEVDQLGHTLYQYDVRTKNRFAIFSLADITLNGEYALSAYQFSASSDGSLLLITFPHPIDVWGVYAGWLIIELDEDGEPSYIMPIPVQREDYYPLSILSQGSLYVQSSQGFFYTNPIWEDEGQNWTLLMRGLELPSAYQFLITEDAKYMIAAVRTRTLESETAIENGQLIGGVKTDIMLYDLATGTSQLLYKGADNITHLSLSKDGTRLLAESHTYAGYDEKLEVTTYDVQAIVFSLNMAS